MTTIAFRGCGLGDHVFTTEKSYFGEEITWNVSKIQRHADEGRFGKPVVVPMSFLPVMSDEEKARVDWDKVGGMLTAHLFQPENSPLARPALQVCLFHRNVLHRIPIDGNHRICARRIAKFEDFHSFVVPATLEARYRVTQHTVPPNIAGESRDDG